MSVNLGLGLCLPEVKICASIIWLWDAALQHGTAIWPRQDARVPHLGPSLQIELSPDPDAGLVRLLCPRWRIPGILGFILPLNLYRACLLGINADRQHDG